MLTIEALRALGARTDEGLARCMNNESFYLRMVGMVLADRNFDALKQAAATGDTTAAFEAAHALKGAVGNVSLTQIYEPVSQLTELLRGKSGPVDTGDLVDTIFAELDKVRKLAK